ncbi:MAG: transcription-repair coupling factor [Gammaproteobacteria bacterium]|nr:transcription-repair coupling factor [Gammaproteobacteria bacterium]
MTYLFPSVTDLDDRTSTPVEYWSEGRGAVRSLAIAEAATRANAPFLVICDNNESVEVFCREIGYFCHYHESLKVLTLPDWETLPYDNFSPHQDIISDRLRALFHLPNFKKGILVVSITSLMHRFPPQSYVLANTLLLKIGQSVKLEKLREQLLAANYNLCEMVYEHGEFAVRGSIVDIFPMGSHAPLRIELWDDEIETIRVFDPETQRSGKKKKEIRLLPGREYPLDTNGVSNFRSAFRERFDIDCRKSPIYQDVSEGIASPGLEYYLSLFFKKLESFANYLPENTVICRTGDLKNAGEKFWNEITERFEERRFDQTKPVLEPNEVFLRVDEVLSNLKLFKQIAFADVDGCKPLNSPALPPLNANRTITDPFTLLKSFFLDNTTHRVLFCAETKGRQESLLETLNEIDLKPVLIDHWDQFVASQEKLAITVANIDQGLWLPEHDLAIVTESLLFSTKVAQRRRRSKKTNTDLIVRDLTELRINDAVVHVDHGIGRYRGLENITTENQTNEFLIIEYAASAKLYVPVSSLHLISRYSGGNQSSAPLNHLGSDQWEKTKRRAAEKIRDVAAELLDVYAQRESKKGFQYTHTNIEYNKFVAAFPFEETADQQAAIDSICLDMAAEQPMDRLICGDVGFGKTEVAMRAAFIAVQNHKQVAILVPTTLLAQQHYETLKDRFSDWPIKVEVISRFKTSAEQKISLNGVACGQTDILIGTHKLLNNEIKYKDLGLLIVDEEHRFGVRQKEKLKSMRLDVDILTLTATPIPRTLNLSLNGIRDLSLIVTPPPRRLSVKTFVHRKQESLIKEACTRELLRGGQVFFVHNEVSSINQIFKELEILIPQSRIAIAHGQMTERDLERVMSDFYHKRYNILVCTTIIETGIDIPNANTIVINRADKLGLAQLHQLRGRVGRSHHQAYAYLLLSTESKIKGDAEKRIEAIKAASELGAGFTLASHDLEIRGAGELLGDDQSGHMAKIGFSLFTEMLEEAVSAIKDGRVPSIDLDSSKVVELNLRIPALIPETYLPDVHLRLIFYKRISASQTNNELRDLQIEMIDRFGLHPEPLKLLFRLTQLRFRAQSCGIKKIDTGLVNGYIQFGPNTKTDPMALVHLIQKTPLQFKFGEANQLKFVHQCETSEDKLNFVNALIDELEPKELKNFDEKK